MVNFIDKAAMYLSPKWGFERLQNRAKAIAMENQVRRYEGAAGGRRHEGWIAKTNESVNGQLKKDLKTLQMRSRDLMRNNGYASNVPGMIANNVVGTGILPSPFIRPVIKGGKLVAPKNTEAIIEAFKAAWNIWADSKQCDYDEANNFYGLQSLVMKTVVQSGECLVIKRQVAATIENPYGLQLQVLETDFIDTSKDEQKENGTAIINGIDYDKDGKKVGYYIYDKHPSDGESKSTLVGIADIIHILDVERPGQNRGVPMASSTLLKQRDLDDYEDAELLAKKVQACLTGFITNTDPEDSGNTNDPVENIEPGTIQYLNQGEQISFTAPPGSSGFADFVRTNQRGIAKGFRVTYEQLTGDYSNVNFSSGRMGWIEFSRQVAYWQFNMLVPTLCDTAFMWFWQRYKILNASGLTEIEMAANWTAPRREMIDPARETTASIMAIKSGLTTLSEELRKIGYNPDDVFKELAEENKKLQQMGIIVESKPAPVAVAK